MHDKCTICLIRVVVNQAGLLLLKQKPRGWLETDLPDGSEPFQADVTNLARLVPETQPPDTLRNHLADNDVILIQVNTPMVDDEDDEEPLEAGRDVEGVHMSGRGRGSSQSSRSRGRGRGRAAPSTEHTPSSPPPRPHQVAPTIPPPFAPSPQPAVTDSHHAAPSSQLIADSSHASQPDPPTQQVVQIPITWDGQKGAIFDMVELMLNEPWINHSEILADVQNRWFDK
ncbi:hypothetical protein PIB30_071920 [Stylosanthes scabra]|uniref:Uncharacterized protein n=1 Tax=Stylosanthes scabra TaxID=79078 RepID=A0ABU6VMW6_9FABA|nr:hypothetical protein [Stylosanthes scabra]